MIFVLCNKKKKVCKTQNSNVVNVLRTWDDAISIGVEQFIVIYATKK